MAGEPEGSKSHDDLKEAFAGESKATAGVLAALVRVLDDVGDVGDPQTKGENRWQPKQSARSCTRLAAPGRTGTGGPIS